jgi:hypothetical protein
MDEQNNLPENDHGKAYIKILEVKSTSPFFGNVCVTNTNCEQQIPPEAGFCFMPGGPKKHLANAFYRAVTAHFHPAIKTASF